MTDKKKAKVKATRGVAALRAVAELRGRLEAGGTGGARGAQARVGAGGAAVAPLAERLLKVLPRRAYTLAELSTQFNVGVGQVREALAMLEARGYHVRTTVDGPEVQASLVKDLPVGGNFRIDPAMIRGRKIRFGAIGDTHLGSKYERLDVLNALYDRFEERGITDVYHTGNIVDGFRRGINDFELLDGCSSMDGQLRYCARHYPQRAGITTHFIAGDDHEGWWVQREGVNIGKLIEAAARDAGRNDLRYLSYIFADLRFPSADGGETWVRVLHPGGGSAYATSYTAQKIVESFQGGKKPAVLLIGHYHKMEYGRPREVLCIQTGCTVDQTSFMFKKRLEAQLGGWIVEIEQGRHGHVANVTLQDFRFYDRGFYEKREKFAKW